MANEFTCTAVHPKTGVRCGLPATHVGKFSHGNGTLTPPWEDAEPDNTPDLWAVIGGPEAQEKS